MTEKKSIVIPDCPCCKNFSEEKKDGKFCCAAFPNGIPYEYMWGEIYVRELHECHNGFKYEKIDTA